MFSPLKDFRRSYFLSVTLIGPCRRSWSAPRRQCRGMHRGNQGVAQEDSPTSSSTPTRSISSRIACRRSRRERRERRRRTRMKKTMVRSGGPQPRIFSDCSPLSSVSHHVSLCIRSSGPAAGRGAHPAGEGSAQGGVHHSDASALPRWQRQGFQLQVGHINTSWAFLLWTVRWSSETERICGAHVMVDAKIRAAAA